MDVKNPRYFKYCFALVYVVWIKCRFFFYRALTVLCTRRSHFIHCTISFSRIQTHSHFYQRLFNALRCSLARSLVRLWIETINMKWMGSVRFSSCAFLFMYGMVWATPYIYCIHMWVYGCRWINTPASAYCALCCVADWCVLQSSVYLCQAW